MMEHKIIESRTGTLSEASKSLQGKLNSLSVAGWRLSGGIATVKQQYDRKGVICEGVTLLAVVLRPPQPPQPTPSSCSSSC